MSQASIAVRRLSRQLLENNGILRGLTEAPASAILERGELIHLALRQKIYEAEKPIQDVYFPMSAILSIVTVMKDGTQIEIGTVGREGTSAFPLLMGARSTANDCYCQVSGDAVKLSVAFFHELVNIDIGFRQLLDRYLQAYHNMLGQNAACNRLHSVYERCARWLLMTHDRVEADTFPLTHEYLAMMLGTGRGGVSIAAASLRKSGFINYTHGAMTVTDKKGLEQASCECYGVARSQFDGLLRRIDDDAHFI